MDISEIKDPKLREAIQRQWAAEDKARGVSSGAVSKPDAATQSVGAVARENSNTVRSFARVTFRCFRLRSLDDENPFTKYFTDALRYAGAIFEDSKEWAKIEVIEEIVTNPAHERTEIEIDYKDSTGD
jgi:hypothetical protein